MPALVTEAILSSKQSPMHACIYNYYVASKNILLYLYEGLRGNEWDNPQNTKLKLVSLVQTNACMHRGQAVHGCRVWEGTVLQRGVIALTSHQILLMYIALLQFLVLDAAFSAHCFHMMMACMHAGAKLQLWRWLPLHEVANACTAGKERIQRGNIAAADVSSSHVSTEWRRRIVLVLVSLSLHCK